MLEPAPKPNPALMSKDQLENLINDMVREPGMFEIQCLSNRDAVNLRLRINKIRSHGRKKNLELVRQMDPAAARFASDAFEWDRVVLTIAPGSNILVVNIAPAAMPLDFVSRVEADGTRVPAFPAANAPAHQPEAHKTHGEEDLI